MTIPEWNVKTREDIIREMSEKFNNTTNYAEDEYYIEISRVVTVPRTENTTISISLQELVDSGALSPTEIYIEDDYSPTAVVDDFTVENAFDTYLASDTFARRQDNLDWSTCDCDRCGNEPTEVESPVVDGWDRN
jgi:hypothetical protein